MALEWIYSLERVDWHDLSALYRAAPLGKKKPTALRTAFANSMFRCLVYDSGILVGAGRALADGIDCSYLCDIAVHPSHQGKGLGKEIVARLVEFSRGHNKIILYAAPGKTLFYEKLGFKRMATAMAIFENQARALELGLVNETSTATNTSAPEPHRGSQSSQVEASVATPIAKRDIHYSQETPSQ